MAVSGKLEVTIKFSQFPTVQLVENGWKRIEIDCGGRIVSATFRPKTVSYTHLTLPTSDLV